MDVSLRVRRHGSADSRGFGGGAQDGCPAGMAGLGRFRSRTGRAAAFPRPARWLVGAALGNSGLHAHAHRQCWNYRRTTHTYRAPFGPLTSASIHRATTKGYPRKPDFRHRPFSETARYEATEGVENPAGAGALKHSQSAGPGGVGASEEVRKISNLK